MSPAFMIFLAAVAAIVVFVIVSYDRLVSLGQRTQSASFPSNLVAVLFQFREHAYFEVGRPEERQVPWVSFGA